MMSYSLRQLGDKSEVWSDVESDVETFCFGAADVLVFDLRGSAAGTAEAMAFAESAAGKAETVAFAETAGTAEAIAFAESAGTA